MRLIVGLPNDCVGFANLCLNHICRSDADAEVRRRAYDLLGTQPTRAEVFYLGKKLENVAMFLFAYVGIFACSYCAA